MIERTECARGLGEAMRELDLGSDELFLKLKEFEKQYADGVYAEVLYLLSHLEIDPPEARRLWERVSAHRASMAERLGHRVDLRVAMLDYFMEVDRRLDNPRIIETQLLDRARDSAFRDVLTGLQNYRFFEQFLAREILKSDQLRAPLSLVLIDVDNFKAYNDAHGHPAGNEALAAVGRVLASATRKSDVAARYGGEEFALVLTSTPKSGALLVAERVRSAIHGEEIRGGSSRSGARVTISLGVATFPADATDAAELVRHADQALYTAKSLGKNRVELFGGSLRSYPRRDATLHGVLQVLGAGERPFTTVQLGENGMSLVADQTVMHGTLVDVTLMLPEPEPPREVKAAGRVIRVREDGRERFQMAVRFLEITAPDHLVLSRYVRSAATSLAR